MASKKRKVASKSQKVASKSLKLASKWLKPASKMKKRVLIYLNFSTLSFKISREKENLVEKLMSS